MKINNQSKILLGVLGVALIALATGCGNSSGQLQVQSSSGADINTRLWYQFSSAPDVFTASSQTILLMHLDEIAGPSVADSSLLVTLNNGDTINSPVFTTGRFSNAVSLNGTTQYIHVTSNSSMDLTNKLTIEAWIRPSTVAAGTRTIVSKWGAAANLGWNLRMNGAIPQLLLSSNGTNSSTFNSTATLVVGQWAHIAAVMDGTFASIYVNGVLAGKFLYNAPIFNSTAAIRIGADNATAGGLNFFNGLIDEVSVKKDASTSLPTVASVVDGSMNAIYGQLIGLIDNSVSPIEGNYLALSGTNQFVQATAQALNIQGAWTAEGYVRTTSVGSPQNIIVKGSVVGNNVNYGIQITSTAPSGRVRVFFNDDFANLYEVYSVTKLATNNWYHVAGSWDGSTLRVYVNGVLEASVTYGSGITPALNSVGVNIGRDSAGANLFTGHLDKIRISDIARTSFLN